MWQVGSSFPKQGSNLCPLQWKHLYESLNCWNCQGSPQQFCLNLYLEIFSLLVFLGFPGSSAGKESTCNGGDPISIPGSGRSTGEGIGYPLQYSCLENPHGHQSLKGYSPWDHKEMDMTERLSTAQLGKKASHTSRLLVYFPKLPF